jgi:hypothetical protein
MTPWSTDQIQIRFLGATAALTILLTGCLTSAEQQALNDSFAIDEGSIAQIPAPPLAPACFNERFVQPAAEISRSIDILFVMDTSGSMDDNRAKAADGISAFVGQLPAAVDYQIGVMLAHGSKSAWSGKLFKYDNINIFSSKTMDVATIQTKLRSMVLHAPTDANGEQGEQGTYSLIKGVTSKLDINRAAGFFRTTAALAVVLVTDENDICAPYANMTTMPGMTSAEKSIRNRDCSGGIATGDVIAKVKAIQGDRPLMFGAVAHKSQGYKDSSGNDGYGWGTLEVTEATGGVSTEINDGDYTEGLANMGRLATVKLNLILDYTLAHADVDSSTLQAFVDGVSVGMTYDPAGNDIHLNSGGTALSVVDINYCLKQTVDFTGAPTPSPSPTPTPTPTPTIIPPLS